MENFRAPPGFSEHAVHGAWRSGGAGRMSERGSSGMTAEIAEAPGAVADQASAIRPSLDALMADLRRARPAVMVTCARGSSAHAAAYGKHLVERYLGLPVAAAAPSIASVYGNRLQLRDQFFLAISQSGRSDDLVAQAEAARAAGAVTAALVNDTASPLARAVRHVVPMAAGPETSVAATKTFIASLAALLRITAYWSGSSDLSGAVDRLPERLAAAAQLDWRPRAEDLRGCDSLIAAGRGPTLAIAREAALKLKETCNLHAEAFSGAEIMHGPVTLVAEAYPVLVFAVTDESAPGLERLVADLRRKGARVFFPFAGGELPTLPADQPDADAICLIQSFYPLAAALAALRGIDIDRPRHLEKVTRTR